MRIRPGDPAPDFDVLDVFEQPVRLGDHRGRRLLLSFYRFASCPFCNLRVNRLLRVHDELSAQGLSLVAVFHSSPELIRRYVGRQDAPFPILADPQKVLYERYGVESSKAAVARAALFRLPDAAVAMAKGFMPRETGADLDVVPADFLIDETSRVRVAYYGRDIGDHLPIERVFSFAAGGGTAHETLSPRSVP